ncbi:In chloroplast atpase biogenesis protein, partial [Thalictrum thalictroides]
VSAMITGEFYTKKDHFPGFGRPFVFNAEVLLKFAVIFSEVGRESEAKDGGHWVARTRLHQEVAEIAQWDDEQIEFIKEKVSEEGRQEDLKKGKASAQVALDEAAFLLDLASLEGNWGFIEERIAECYKEAGLHDIARFVLYRD